MWQGIYDITLNISEWMRMIILTAYIYWKNIIACMLAAVFPLNCTPYAKPAISEPITMYCTSTLQKYK